MNSKRPASRPTSPRDNRHSPEDKRTSERSAGSNSPWNTRAARTTTDETRVPFAPGPSRDGPGSPRFCFAGEVASPTSWGRIVREILLAARDLEMPLALRPIKGYAFEAEYPLPDFLARLSERPPLGKIQIAVQPAFCLHLPEPRTTRWACTSFCLPPTPAEVKNLQGFHQIWVFSEDHRQALARAGIPLERIRALPLAVHPKMFHLRAPRHPDIPRDNRFRFLYVGNPLRRKAVDLVLRAYLEEFRTAEPVELVIKLTHLPRIKKQFDYEIADLAKRLGAINNLFPRVRVITGCWEDKDLAGLMTACQTLVSADRAYFTGLVVREGMACGVPVIGPAILGPLAGLTAETGWFVQTREVEYEPGILFPGSPKTRGEEVDIADLRRLMREAFTQPGATRKKGVEAARAVAQAREWRETAERLRAEGARTAEELARRRAESAPPSGGPGHSSGPSSSHAGSRRTSGDRPGERSTRGSYKAGMRPSKPRGGREGDRRD